MMNGESMLPRFKPLATFPLDTLTRVMKIAAAMAFATALSTLRRASQGTLDAYLRQPES